MTIEKLMKDIGLQEQVSRMVFDSEIPFAAVERYFELLQNRNTWETGLEKIKHCLEPDKSGIKMLAVHLYLATRAFEEYKKMNISPKIFVDTMKCFVRFVAQHKTVYKKWCFDREWWTVRQLSLSLFRIGQLEFELNEIKGKKCVSMHIPSDASIAPDQCDKSIAMAREFLKQYFPQYQFCEFVCDSWLLSPCLRLLLPPTSNIIKFLNRFSPVQTNDDSMDFMLYVFNTDTKDFSKLPATTTLQKNMKAHLLSGGKIGATIGILKN